MKKPIIQIQNLYFYYNHTQTHIVQSEIEADNNTDRFVLQGINLNIYEGDYVAVIGANGSGKSTLLRHLNALLLPVRGEVWVNEWNTKQKENLKDIRSTVGMVFQVPDEQIVSTVVEEEVAFGPENLGIPEPELSQRVRSALEITGLGKLKKRQTHSLSGGQKQLLALTSTLSMNPPCLVLDEATSMLDPVFRKKVFDIMDELQTKGITVIFATHSMEEASRARTVVVLHQGRVVMAGESDEVLTREKKLKKMGMDSPIYAKLARKVSKGVSDFPSKIITKSGFLYALDRYMGKNRILQNSQVLKIKNKKSENIRGNGSPLIEINNLFYTYLKGTPVEVKALHGVNFVLYPGEAVGIIGSTGSGKSTLVQHMNGLFRPQRGEVKVFGMSLVDENVNIPEIRQKIGLLFQNPEDQLFEKYAGDDVAFAPLNIGFSIKEARELVREAMEIVGLPFSYKDRLTAKLSHGEKRRIALAGVLAMKPQVLVLDEPTSGLDPGGKEHLLKVLETWYKGSERSIVMVSHDMDEIAMFCDRVYVLENGKVLMEGIPAEIFSRKEELLRAGLGLSPFWELSEELEKRGLHLSESLMDVENTGEELVRLLKIKNG